MRYHNPDSGFSVDLGSLDDEKKRFFRVAQAQFSSNANWFEFEQLVFSYTSPVFHRSRNRADVLSDPLYHALKDMWLQLGIKQGFVAVKSVSANAKTKDETKKGPARPNGTARVRDLETASQSSIPRRRGR
jgi:hypothetical protein